MKQTGRQVFWLFTAAVLAFCCVPHVQAAECQYAERRPQAAAYVQPSAENNLPEVVKEGVFTFRLYSDLHARLTGCSKTAEGIIEVPGLVRGCSVTVIDTEAFAGCSGITAAVLPDSITAIMSGAFRSCTALTDINIPGSVSGIEADAFAGCSKQLTITGYRGTAAETFAAGSGIRFREPDLQPDASITLRHGEVSFDESGLVPDVINIAAGRYFVSPGETVHYQIRLLNNTGYDRCSYYLHYPSFLSVVCDEKGRVIRSFGPAGDEAQLTCMLNEEFSSLNIFNLVGDYEEESGVMAEILFTVPADAEPGDLYPVTLTGTRFAHMWFEDGVNHTVHYPCAVHNGWIKVIAGEAAETTAAVTAALKSATTTAAQITTTAKPAATAQITTTAKPVTTAQITTTAKPAATAQITTTAKPAATAQIITTAKPVTTAQITTTAKSATTAKITTTAMAATTAPIPAAAPRGDVDLDGAVSVEDAQCALIAYTNGIAGKPDGLTPEQRRCGDVNGDGALSVDDVQNILIYYVCNTVSGKLLTWDALLNRQKAPAFLRKGIMFNEVYLSGSGTACRTLSDRLRN